MAVALEIGVGHLLAELLADALGILGALQAAGTIAAGAPEPVPNCIDNAFIGV